jgi:hypothetical protein
MAVLLFCCKEDEYRPTTSTGTPYDPNAPVVVTGFMPDSGRLREKVVITGSNFGNDTEKVQVYFNDGFSDKKATVLNVDGTAIYCLAPRQSDGRSTIKVVVQDDVETAAPGTFRYTELATVSWVAGAGTINGIGQKYSDGTLLSSDFWQVQGIASLGDDMLMTVGFWDGRAPYARLISLKDDKVVTLQSNVYLGKPAVNEAKTRAYAALVNSPFTVYEYRKEAGWMAFRLGEIDPTIGQDYDRTRAVVLMDKAHDPNEEWLYFANRHGFFGRFNVQTQVSEVLGSNLDYPVGSFAGYLVYDKFKDCFYLSIFNVYTIYKISRTGATWTDGVKSEVYAGSSSRSAVIDGPLDEARFRQPMGMCMDGDGNLYICDCDGADVIRKISAYDGYVSTIAGRLGVESPQVNGDPAEAVFLDPQDITYDGEGNFFIAEWWETTIRKYAIE